jgi:meckelin
MDTDNFWRSVTGIFIGVMILVALIVIIQTCIFSWSPQLSDD